MWRSGLPFTGRRITGIWRSPTRMSASLIDFQDGGDTNTGDSHLWEGECKGLSLPIG